MTTLDEVADLGAMEHGLAVISTSRADGTIQSSLVNAGVMQHPLGLLLREAFTAAGGTHDNWAEYDRVMAEQRRTLVLVEPTRIYGS
jgi:hypothetical protein